MVQYGQGCVYIFSDTTEATKGDVFQDISSAHIHIVSPVFPLCYAQP